MLSVDTLIKTKVEDDPIAFIREFVRGAATADIVFIEHINTEQPTVRMRRADSVMKALIDGQETLIHIEFQTRDSYDPEMGFRMAEYMLYLNKTHDLPVYSAVIYLHPDAGRRDTGVYRKECRGTGISVSYQVLRLAEMDGQSVLDAGLTALVPLAPLMRAPPGVDDAEWLRRIFRTAVELEVPDPVVYYGIIAMLSGVRYKPEDIDKIMKEIFVNQPAMLTYWAEQAHELGARTNAIENIVNLLALRLAPEVATSLKPDIEQIEDLEHLKSLVLAAALAETVEDFRRALESNVGAE